MQPRSPEALYELARVYEARGDVESALASVAEKPLLEDGDQAAADDGGTPYDSVERRAKTRGARGRTQETASRVPS